MQLHKHKFRVHISKYRFQMSNTIDDVLWQTLMPDNGENYAGSVDKGSNFHRSILLNMFCGNLVLSVFNFHIAKLQSSMINETRTIIIHRSEDFILHF